MVQWLLLVVFPVDTNLQRFSVVVGVVDHRKSMES